MSVATRAVAALACVLGLLVLGSDSEARVAGGGRNPSSDCFVEFDGITATDARGSRVNCTDGDPACDRDGACDGSCEFLVRLCVNQCTTPPLLIERLRLKGPALELPTLPTRERACGGYSSITVPASLTRRPRRRKPTFQLTAFGERRLKLDKDKVSLACLPRENACPPLLEAKDQTVASLPVVSVDPPSPTGGAPATVTVSFPSATSVTLAATGEACGGFGAHGPGPSPLVITQPVGAFGACELTATVTTAGGPETFMTRFEVTPTELSVPALGVLNATFHPGTLPPQSSTPDDPMIGAIDAPGTLINGGSAQVRLLLANPAQAADAKSAQVQVNGAGGFTGYYEAPVTAEGGVIVVPVVLAAGFSSASPIDLFVQLVDRFGNIGNRMLKSFGLVEVGSGTVQVSLSFNTPTDVDLHVVEPNGFEIFYGARESPSGGMLDLDSNAGCSIDGINNENVTWSGAPPEGRYIVRVDFWDDCGGHGADYTVTTRFCGRAETFTGSFAPGASDHGGAGSGVEVARFDTRCGARVRGKAVYEDFAQTTTGLAATSTMLPIRFARVEVKRASDDATLGEGRTEQDGTFDVPFENDGANGYYVLVIADQDDAILSQGVANDVGKLYAVRSEGTFDETVEPDKTGVVITATAGGAGPAFNIFDTGVAGAMLVRSVHSATPPRLSWLWTRGKKGTCTGKVSCYFRDSRTISVLSIAEDPDEYDDLVLLHEYGHFYQNLFSRTDSPGGSHSSSSQVDPRLAWSEGSATFFGNTAKGSSLYLDTTPAGVGVRVDLESLEAGIPLGTSDGSPTGNLSEAVVAAILWDLSDPTNEATDTLTRRDAVFSALTYLGGTHFADRASTGADLIDALDGWFCLGHDTMGDATSGVQGNVVGQHQVSYDFAVLPSCK